MSMRSGFLESQRLNVAMLIAHKVMVPNLHVPDVNHAEYIQT
jgi:hypothetical protein